MFLPRLELMGEAGGKGGAESFSKNCKLHQFKLQHRHYLNLDNGCKPVLNNIILFFKSDYKVTVAN